MTPEAQRIAIAEACGWKEIGKSGVYQNPTKGINGCMPGGDVHKRRLEMKLPGANSLLVPNYLNDLNAMHEAVMGLDSKQRITFGEELVRHVIGANSIFIKSQTFDCINATAAQRAEAFLRTLGKWDDSK